METGTAILDIVPTMIPVADGSWLAVAGDEALVRVGVLEATESLARQRFGEALSRIAAALDAEPREAS